MFSHAICGEAAENLSNVHIVRKGDLWYYDSNEYGFYGV